MKNNDLLDAIGRADGRFKQEVIDHMNNTTNTDKGRYQKPSPIRRTLRQIPAAAALICLLGVTAYAAVTHWGIFDFQKDSLRPFPTEAQEIVQPQTETGNNDYVTCEITESVNDGRQLNLTVRMQSAVPGKYILMFQMEDTTLPASYYGADYDGTIGAYAEENNMIPVMIGTHVEQLGDGGTGVQSIQEKHQSPDVMDLLIKCNLADVGSSSEGILSYVAHELDAQVEEDFHRGKIPFTFQLTADSQSETYKPVNQPDVEGVEILDVTVNHTELRTYIEITEKINMELWADDIPIFRFSPDGEYKFAGAGGYTEKVEPGVYKFVEEMVKTDLGDSFTMELIQVFGPEGKTVLGEVTFARVS